MRNKLCMLLLLAWFSVSALYAQKSPPTGLTPEQAQQWRETVEINKMLLARQNPQVFFPKEKVQQLQEAKAKQNEVVPASPVAKYQAMQRKMQEYFKAHPEAVEKYGDGNMPALVGTDAVLAETKAASLEEVNFETLTEKQQIQLIEADAELKEIWANYETKLKHLNKEQQAQARANLWKQVKQK